MKEYYTRKECSERLGVSGQLISYYVEQGALNGIRSRNLLLIEKESFERFMNSFKTIKENHEAIESLKAEKERERAKLEKEIEKYKNSTRLMNAANSIKDKHLMEVMFNYICKRHKIEGDKGVQLTTDFLKGMPIAALARHYDIHPNTVYLTLSKQCNRISRLTEELLADDEEINRLMDRADHQHRHIKRLEKCLMEEEWIRKAEKRKKDALIEQLKIRCSEIKLEKCHLSVRASNCLRISGINTLEDLLSKNRSDLYKIRNFGKKTMSELEDLVELLNTTTFDHELKIGMFV